MYNRLQQANLDAAACWERSARCCRQRAELRALYKRLEEANSAARAWWQPHIAAMQAAAEERRIANQHRVQVQQTLETASRVPDKLRMVEAASRVPLPTRPPPQARRAKAMADAAAELKDLLHKQQESKFYAGLAEYERSRRSSPEAFKILVQEHLHTSCTRGILQYISLKAVCN